MCIWIPRTLGAVETPGGFEFAPGTTYSIAPSLYSPSCTRVDEALGLLRIDDEVVDQGLVEEVVAHDAGGWVRDAAGDDPVAGTVHVAELVAGCLGHLDVVEPGRDLSDHREVRLPGGRGDRARAEGDDADDRQEDRQPDSSLHVVDSFRTGLLPSRGRRVAAPRAQIPAGRRFERDRADLALERWVDPPKGALTSVWRRAGRNHSRFRRTEIQSSFWSSTTTAPTPASDRRDWRASASRSDRSGRAGRPTPRSIGLRKRAVPRSQLLGRFSGSPVSPT